jgi:Mrp family chromosome partitioning ATPase
MSRLHDAIEKARKEGTVKKPLAPERLPGHADAALAALAGSPTFLEGATVTPRIDGCLVELLKEDEPWLEQVRTLATRLRAMEGAERVRRIGLMSAVGGEGKTTLAAFLSFVLAEQPGESVLLVDCDLRHREVETLLGLSPTPGLSDWLKSPSTEITVRRLGRSGPFVLGAGRPFARPWELVSSPHLGTLLDTAAQRFRYVVVDCPAEGPVADASKIQEHVDALLLVVRARTAPREAILSTIEHLQEEKILGVLFNGEFQGNGSKYYGYSRYSKSYSKRKDRKRKG